MTLKKLLFTTLLGVAVISCSKDNGPSTPTAQTPTITSFTPKSGTVGTLVTINGTNFSTTASANTVKIGSTTATVSTATATKLTITVPQGATTGKVSVAVGGKTATSTDNFTVTAPVATNNPPVIAAQEFNVLESAKEIGTVVASDQDQEDNLVFVIATNDDDLFTIEESTGLLSLAEGKKLDFDTADLHTITVEVSDGQGGVASSDITINVAEDFAPTGETQYGFSAEETIADTEIIGIINMDDPEGQTVTLSISDNDNDLFEINSDGELSLVDGKNLDYENAMAHNITVTASDGFNEIAISVTINVEDIITIDDPSTFVTTWLTDFNGDTIEIGLNNLLDYNFTINWGDGIIETITGSGLSSIDHQYGSQQPYQIIIQGEFPAIRIDNLGAHKLRTIDQWGEIVWQSMENAFYGCVNLEINAVDLPNLSQVTIAAYAFADCISMEGLGGSWDVSNIEDMAFMFWGATSFNGSIGGWTTTSLQNMQSMFQDATDFNKNIGDWDTSNVTNMNNTFNNASSFSNSLANWDVSSLTTATGMFNNSGMSQTSYNTTLIGWSGQQANLQPDVTVGANGLQYCGQDAIDAMNILEGIGWDFVGDVGLANCP
ncbi:BspA family leucine-rich repeat surface protein [Muricauda sp. JGD-17]|uniref:BspA family leucine-rich repeat surface protein n=1 Tax=Flagellimonas ochracea TaxID=2696472 RepID=A0A964TCL1_9FLAO|nr:BspA family leucine-rich repeat surface protein [Allomuricauda ochracea]NAY91548.1 BspA family leucine-rich repeat surface protein [Allomuricauda ochracea]